MKCTDVKSRLPLLLSSHIQEPDDAALRGHLDSCDDCRHEWLELKRLGELLKVGSEPAVRVDRAALYRQAAVRQAQAGRRWRWLGLAACVMLAVGGVWTLVGRFEIRVTGQEFILRWGTPAPALASAADGPAFVASASIAPEKREEQLEVLAGMVRAMVQELQTVEMRQSRDRADLDIRVSGIQEQSLKRWVALQKDLEALYVLTQKGE